MASVINPDGNLYIINGDVKITGEIIAGDGVGSDTLRIASINDLDLTGFPANLPADYDSADAALNVRGGAWVGGNAFVGGTLIANGDVISLGNSGGSLTLNSNISSNVLPAVADVYDIGNPGSEWRSGVFSQIVLSTTPAIISPIQPDIPTGFGTTSVVHLTTSSNTSLTMPDGANAGEIKIIMAVETPTSPVTVTPTTAVGFSYFTLTNAGDSITLMYTAFGWVITSAFRTNVTN
jgi:hypothetical protein